MKLSALLSARVFNPVIIVGLLFGFPLILSSRMYWMGIMSGMPVPLNFLLVRAPNFSVTTLKFYLQLLAVIVITLFLVHLLQDW